MPAGCTHFIIGRDMAGSKSSVTGEDFYGAYEAQEVAQKHAMELNMQTVPSLNITYTEVRPWALDCSAQSLVGFVMTKKGIVEAATEDAALFTSHTACPEGVCPKFLKLHFQHVGCPLAFPAQEYQYVLLVLPHTWLLPF